jgi:hypothetical protein
MGELCQNEIELISIYKKCSKTCLSTKLSVKQNIRGQQPLSFPFTKIILFNCYFSHKRNPRNMTSPFFWAMFGTFGQVVELEKGALGLQRTIVFNQILSSMIHEPLLSKHDKCLQSPPNPSPRVMLSPQKVMFWPFQASCLACRGWVRSSKVSSRPPNACNNHPERGPLVSTLCDSSPMEAQARIVLPKLSTNWVLQRQMNTPSKDLKSNTS